MSKIESTHYECDSCHRTIQSKELPKDWKRVELVVSTYDPGEGWGAEIWVEEDICPFCEIEKKIVTKRKDIEG